MLIRICRGLKSFSGHPLAGDRVLRFLFLDESGVSGSPNEPLGMVVAVILNADQQWNAVERRLNEIRERFDLPNGDTPFVFHGTDIYSGKRTFADRSKWPVERRIELYGAIADIRADFDLPVSVGYWEKAEIKERIPNISKRSLSKLCQLMCYMNCLVGCEKYLRDFAAKDEVALVHAEDAPSVRVALTELHHEMVTGANGIPDSNGMIPLRHIKRTVTFSNKANNQLIQLSDCYAFLLRRHFSGDRTVSDLMKRFHGALGNALMSREEGLGRAGTRVYVSKQPPPGLRKVFEGL